MNRRIQVLAISIFFSLFFVLYHIKSNDLQIMFRSFYWNYTQKSKHFNCNVYTEHQLKKIPQNVTFPSHNLILPDNVKLKIFHYGSKDDVSASIINSGSWESHILDIMIAILKKHSTLQLLDFGSYIGVYTLAAASLGRKVVAVEAMETTCQRVYSSLMANNFTDRVTLVNNALTDYRSKKIIGINFANVGGSTVFHESSSNSTDKNFQTEVITSIYMNDLLEVITFSRAIMKIDIEGSEHRALKQADRLFDKVDIPIVIMEFGQNRGPVASKIVVDFFTKRDYEDFVGLNQYTQPLNITMTDKWPWDIVWKKKSFEG